MSSRLEKIGMPAIALGLIAIIISGVTLFYVTTVVSDLSELSENLTEAMSGLSGTVSEIAETVGAPVFDCPICGAIFPTQEALTAHTNSFHPGETLNIGMIAPFTGPQSYIGYWSNLIYPWVEEEINENGGVLGRPINFIYQDSEGTVDGEVSAMERLVTLHGVKIILGGQLTSLTLAGMDVAAKYEILYIATHATGIATPLKYLSDPDKYWMVFQNFANATAYALASFQWLMAAIERGDFTPQTNTFAQIAEDADFGRLLTDTHRDLLEAEGWTEVAMEYVDVATVDFYSVLTKIKALNPDVLFTSGIAAATWGSCQKQFVENDLECLHIDFHSATPGFLEVAGTAANGLIYEQAGCFVPGYSPQTADFISRFKARYPDAAELDQSPAIHYDCVYRLMGVIEKAGTADDVRAMAEAWETYNYTGTVGKYVTSRDHGTLAGWEYITSSIWQIQDMEYQLIWPYHPEEAVPYQKQPWLP